jgi:hypothetical protein
LFEVGLEHPNKSLALPQDPSKKQAEEAERAKRIAPKPKPKYDSKSGKWIVMNWDGTVAGIEGGDQINFIDRTRQISPLTEPTMGSERTNTSSLHGSDVAVSHSSPEDGPNLFQVQEASLCPFARVNTVAVDSPAEGAGLKEDDLIIRFGHLDADNHDHLKAIAVLVPEIAGEGGEVRIEILRRTVEYNEITIQDASNMTAGSKENFNDPSRWERLTVSLAPRPWSGRGLIGKEYDQPP